MNFSEPEWLYLLLVPPVLIPLAAWAGWNKRKKVLALLLGNRTESGTAVHLSPLRRFWRFFLLTASVMLLAAAVSRPYVYSRLLPFEAKGRDLLVVCDVSRSMNSTDLAPSRLKHARFLLRQLAAKERGDRFGLVAFAGSAYLNCPLTSDPVTFNEYVDELSTDTVPAGGTDLEKALRVAEKAFAGSESSNKAIILLTDGEEVQGNTLAVAADLKKKNIPVFAVGFGDPVNGAVIPVEEGKNALVRDASGKVVTSKLNEKILMQLAAETKGIYVRTTVTDPGLTQLERAISRLGRSGRENVKKQIPVEEFPKLLAAGGILLLIFLLLSERKESRKISCLLVCCCLTLGAAESGKKPEPAKADEKVVLPLPSEPEALYNLARKLQTSGDSKCNELYTKVLQKVPPESSVAARSFHNLGAGRHQQCRAVFENAQKQLGAQQMDQALQTLDEAGKQADAAEELYSRAASGARALPAPLGANLTRLAKDREKIKELKKKIEELKKQQQKAQNQTRQAQQKNQQSPASPQQRQQQKQSIDQAQKASQQLEQRSRQMGQKELADAARKASEELKKAADAKEKKQDAQSRKHLEQAMKELAGKENKTSPQKEQSDKAPARSQQKQSAQGSPGEEKKKLSGKESAEQLLEMMGEEDKKLREAMKQQQKMRRRKVEKDW